MSSSFSRVNFRSPANKEEKPCHSSIDLQKIYDKRFSREAIPSSSRSIFSEKNSPNTSTINRQTSSNFSMTDVKVEDLQPAKKNMKQDQSTKSFSSQSQEKYVPQHIHRNVNKVQWLPDEEVVMPELEPETRFELLGSKGMTSCGSFISDNDDMRHTVFNRDQVPFLLQRYDPANTYQLSSVSRGRISGSDNNLMGGYDQFAELRCTLYGNLERIRIMREAKLSSIACRKYQLACEEEELSKINLSYQNLVKKLGIMNKKDPYYRKRLRKHNYRRRGRSSGGV